MSKRGRPVTGVWSSVIRDVRRLSSLLGLRDDACRLLVDDIRSRHLLGLKEETVKPSSPKAGRDALLEAYWVALDCCALLRQHRDKQGRAPSPLASTYHDALKLAFLIRVDLLLRETAG